jgi:hypothetical protein
MYIDDWIALPEEDRALFETMAEKAGVSPQDLFAAFCQLVDQRTFSAIERTLERIVAWISENRDSINGGGCQEEA